MGDENFRANLTLKREEKTIVVIIHESELVQKVFFCEWALMSVACNV